MTNIKVVDSIMSYDSVMKSNDVITGVYQIRNKHNNKVYIGGSGNIKQRFKSDINYVTQLTPAEQEQIINVIEWDNLKKD